MEPARGFPFLGRGALPCCLQPWPLISSCSPPGLLRARLPQSSPLGTGQASFLPSLPPPLAGGTEARSPGKRPLASLFAQLCKALSLHITSCDPPTTLGYRQSRWDDTCLPAPVSTWKVLATRGAKAPRALQRSTQRHGRFKGDTPPRSCPSIRALQDSGGHAGTEKLFPSAPEGRSRRRREQLPPPGPQGNPGENTAKWKEGCMASGAESVGSEVFYSPNLRLKRSRGSEGLLESGSPAPRTPNSQSHPVPGGDRGAVSRGVISRGFPRLCLWCSSPHHSFPENSGGFNGHLPALMPKSPDFYGRQNISYF
nr:uncharacterized protein LOC105868781 [Microcebus murinus]